MQLQSNKYLPFHAIQLEREKKYSMNSVTMKSMVKHGIAQFKF